MKTYSRVVYDTVLISTLDNFLHYVDGQRIHEHFSLLPRLRCKPLCNCLIAYDIISHNPYLI